MTRSAPCEVIGHAGADGFFPPNTDASFRKAIELGVDRIECDVTGDSDRTLFLVHDQDIHFGGERQNVRALSLAQIRQVDPEIVTLEELIAATNGHPPLLLDLKARGFEPELIVAIKTMLEADNQVSISGTHARTLRKIGKAVPGLRIGLSRGHWVSRVPSGRLRRIAGWGEACLQIIPLIALGKWCHATEFMLKFELCVPPLVAIMHKAGFRIYSWTPEHDRDFRILLGRGVDGIISHRPDRLIDTLAAAGVPRL